MTPGEARQISELLRDEANELARLLDASKDGLRSRRERVALEREMQRLRELAEAVKPFTSPAYTETAFPR